MYSKANLVLYGLLLHLHVKYAESSLVSNPALTCSRNDCPDTDACSSNPCGKNGLCMTDPDGKFKCICEDGYYGKQCETKADCSKYNPCKNGATCKPDTKSIIKCCCAKGYTGEFCQVKVTCSDRPCRNGGTCVKKNGENGEMGYACSCAAGFYGTNCEILEFPCDKDITTNLQKPDTGEEELEKIIYDDCEKCRAIHGTCEKCCEKKCHTIRTPAVSFEPTEKPFCPVVRTIKERDGCKKCKATDDTCHKCCKKKYDKCIANCQRLEKFCEQCKASDIKTQCKKACPDLNGNTDPTTEALCEKTCKTEEKSCKDECTNDGTAKLTPCPSVYSCDRKDADAKKECRAFKLPSGKIVCFTRDVPSIKDEYHSYLQFPRIHFGGKVQIDSATLNNIFSNFDTKTFAPVDNEISDENWNPMGSSEFSLVDIVVTRVCYESGFCVFRQHVDPVAQAMIKDQANGKVAAKIVDLDVEVQGRVSEIYGMSIDVGGFFKGDMERASFQSLWYKIKGVNDDFGQGSRFQSVLNNVQFSPDYDKSKIAQYLKENIGPERKLSICFNIDMVGEHHYSNFSFARIVGSIGLAGESAPPFFVHGRLLRHLPATMDLNYAPFTVESGKESHKVYIDLGNALAIDRKGAIVSSIGDLALGIYDGEGKGVEDPNCLTNIRWVARIYYHEYGGYFYTSGINVVSIPPVPLKKQFVLAKFDASGSCEKVVLAEHKDGFNVRPKSHFLFRAEHEEVITGSMFVTLWGAKPENENDVENLDLKLKTANSIIRGHTLDPLQPFGLFQSTQPSEYTYYFYAKTKIDNIRKTVDGQIYALQYTFNGYPLNADRNEAMNTAVFIHVYDAVNPNKKVAWITDVLPIFQVYGNLFPVMRSFVDLADYYSVVERKCHIITAMSLDFEDPQFMPVTRDLSPAKNEMILKWLDAGTPELGKAHRTEVNKQHLLDMLQTALQLEHATIPIYFNGYLSIKPFQNDEVKSMLHQIIVDEMFHFAQVANIINALGGRPYILENTFVPAFPSHLPGGCRPNMIATINKISAQQVHDVYMEIEEPTNILAEHELIALINTLTDADLQPVGAPGEEDGKPKAKKIDCFKDLLRPFPLSKRIYETNYDTIGELYRSVVYVIGLLTICGKKDIFTGKTPQIKWHDENRIREVKSYKDALAAIKVIVDQGEGASLYNPLQRSSTSSPLSHYYKFSSIYHGNKIATFQTVNESHVLHNNQNEAHENYVYLGDKIPFFQSGVWNMVRDPMMSKYKPNSIAYKNAQAFNDMYRQLLETMQMVFDGQVDRFDDAFGLMKSLIVYGNRVVQTPIDDNGDADVGPNAGPTYFN